MLWLFLGLILLALLFVLIANSAPRFREPNLSSLPERFVILDLETTGLDPSRHEIIEIGAIRVNRNSTTHDTFQTLVIPRKSPSKKIVEITGITKEMLHAEGVEIREAMVELVKFIGDLPLVTFNAEFDMAFLRAAGDNNGVSIQNRTSCALSMARRAWPGLKSYRLQDLAEAGGFSAVSAHRAIADCQMALIGLQCSWF